MRWINQQQPPLRYYWLPPLSWWGSSPYGVCYSNLFPLPYLLPTPVLFILLLALNCPLFDNDFLIYEAIVIKLSSTLIFVFADVSIYGMSYCLAKSSPSCLLTWRFSTKSTLLPTSTLQTLSFANLSISCIHYFTLSKVSLSVTS